MSTDKNTEADLAMNAMHEALVAVITTTMGAQGAIIGLELALSGLRDATADAIGAEKVGAIRQMAESIIQQSRAELKGLSAAHVEMRNTMAEMDEETLRRCMQVSSRALNEIFGLVDGPFEALMVLSLCQRMAELMLFDGADTHATMKLKTALGAMRNTLRGVPIAIMPPGTHVPMTKGGDA